MAIYREMRLAGYTYILRPTCIARAENLQAIHYFRLAFHAPCVCVEKSFYNFFLFIERMKFMCKQLVFCVYERKSYVWPDFAQRDFHLINKTNSYLSIKSLAISFNGPMYLRAVDGCSITCCTWARNLSHFSPCLRMTVNKFIDESIFIRAHEQMFFFCENIFAS